MQDCKVQKSAEGGSEPIVQESSAWTRLINDIIRPERANYNQEILGGSSFSLFGTTFERKDMVLQHEEKTITLTTYQPERKNMWMVLYLHGNSASRAEALTIIRFLPQHFSMACFDFIACGHNYQHDTISLGVRESRQVETVVNFLELLGFRVILWGRSMGAVTALKFGKSPIIVADSAFSSFRDLCKDLAKQHAPFLVPDLLINCLFPCIYCQLKSDIMEKAQFDVDELEMVEQIKKIRADTMIVFLSGKEDKLVRKEHSKKLYKQFLGEKKHLQIFPGQHNQRRPNRVYNKVMNLIMEFIRQRSDKMSSIINTSTKVSFDVY